MRTLSYITFIGLLHYNSAFTLTLYTLNLIAYKKYLAKNLVRIIVHMRAGTCSLKSVKFSGQYLLSEQGLYAKWNNCVTV